MTTTTVRDGVYFLYSEGCAWIAARFRGGKLIATTEEANAGTHAAANDSWAGIVPAESDVEVDGDEYDAIVAAVMPDVDPRCVSVSRPEPV